MTEPWDGRLLPGDAVVQRCILPGEDDHPWIDLVLWVGDDGAVHTLSIDPREGHGPELYKWSRKTLLNAYVTESKKPDHEITVIRGGQSWNP